MLDICNITQTFGGVTALDNVSLSISKGDITGIIGPNGAGKTTLFNIISGIYQQTSGRVYLNGLDITDHQTDQLASLGMVRTFQNIELFGQMSVLENVMVGLHTRSKSGLIKCALKLPWCKKEEEYIKNEAMKLLEFVNIADVSDIEASSLPFGKGRLLEIARAMATEPQIILMDEPAAGLNSQETITLAKLICDIRNMGISVVLVEHDMELVMDICDKIIVLNLGKKLAEGSPKEIQDNHEVVVAYLGDDN